MTSEQIIAELIAAVEWFTHGDGCSQSNCCESETVGFWIDSDGQPMPICAEDLPGSGVWYMFGDEFTPGYAVTA